MDNRDNEKELYKFIIEYVGSPILYLELNRKLRESNNNVFEKLLKPYIELAKINKEQGFNEHTSVYRGIQFRSEPYEKWWKGVKELDEYRRVFPYIKDVLKIKKKFITEGNKTEINQLLATSLDIQVALDMADAEYFKFKRNPLIAKKMFKFVFEIPILKKNNQINVYKLYTYFKRKYNIKDLQIKQEIVDNFLKQMDKRDPSFQSEIILVPDISTKGLIQTVESGFPTKFKDIQKQIKRNYKVVDTVENKDDIVTKDTFFIKMSIQ